MNKRFLLIAILFVSALLFTACGAKKEVDLTIEISLPTWYTNPPRTTDSTLYAVGEAQNKEEAIINALNNMASTLSVSVESQFKSKEVVREGSGYSRELTASNEIQSDVKRIRISHYEVLNYKEAGFRKHVVLIKSDKQKLFESLKKELEQKFALIEKQRENLEKYHAIKQLSIYKTAKSELEYAPNTLIVMNVLNPAFNGDKYLDKIQRVNSDYDNLLSNITFSLKSNSEAKNLEASIRNGLSNKDLQIQYSTGKKHFVITITSKIQKAASHGFAIARCAIEIRVRDYRGSVIGSNKLNIVGQSTQGYEIAKENIAIKLNEMIKKEGISKVIGIDI